MGVSSRGAGEEPAEGAPGRILHPALFWFIRWQWSSLAERRRRLQCPWLTYRLRPPPVCLHDHTIIGTLNYSH